MNVGFVGVRFAGLDGVSLESAKLASVLEDAGHAVAWFAGELGEEFAPGDVCEPARFDTRDNLELQDRCFGTSTTNRATLDLIEHRADVIEAELVAFIEQRGIDVLVPQNAMSIPMQLPLGVALARLAGRGTPMVAHHHDFGWERERFWPNGVESVLDSSFPATAPSVSHLVINSIAQRELRERTGADARVLPNVMDFERKPHGGRGSLFRKHAGVGPDDIVLLQATRLIPRKAIELTLEVAGRLRDDSIRVIATHPDLDEGAGYAEGLRRIADDLGVDYRLAAVGGPGQPSLADAYDAADLVMYPSRIEGFGNALLEAVYYGRCLLVNRYPVYVSDIAPTGLKAIEIDGEITKATLEEVTSWLSDPSYRDAVSAENYQICTEHFSHETVRQVALPLFDL